MISTLAIVCLLSACAEQKTTGVSAFDSEEAKLEFLAGIDPIVQDYIQLDLFSGVVLVADRGENIFLKAYGMADRGTERPNDLNTLFDIGSMNKTFTQVVVKQLVEEGTLKLTDHLSDYVSDFEDTRVELVTISHLLEHRSGFGDYHGLGYFELPLKERSLNAIVERAKSSRLLFEPGEEEAYSNLGYVILGKIIEEATGKSYFENVRERVVDRLGLKNTYLHNFTDLEGRIAKGYLYTPLGQLEENIPILDSPNPDGGFLSTTEDIKTFYHAYYFSTALLSEETKAQDPYFQFLKDMPKGRVTSAAGGFEGFNSVILQAMHPNLCIIVFANMDEPVAERLGMDILSHYRGKEVQKPSLPAIQNVRVSFEEKGIEFVREHFDSLTVNFHPTDPRDIILNDLGYAYLYGAEDATSALKIFKLNTELFPGVANCWDSYGEALKAEGKEEMAITAYEKALELRPDLESALEALSTLKK
jgi:CubicO group peptidase (beta-lactamase class C family)